MVLGIYVGRYYTCFQVIIRVRNVFVSTDFIDDQYIGRLENALVDQVVENFILIKYLKFGIIGSNTLRVYGKSAHLHPKFRQNFGVRLSTKISVL